MEEARAKCLVRLTKVCLHMKINQLIFILLFICYEGAWIKNTTVGSVIFNSILPKGVKYVNKIVDKKILTKVINDAYLISGNYQTVKFLDELKT